MRSLIFLSTLKVIAISYGNSRSRPTKDLILDTSLPAVDRLEVFR